MAKSSDWRNRAAQDERRIKYLATEYCSWLAYARAAQWILAKQVAVRCANTLARFHNPAVHLRAQTLGWAVHVEAQRLAALQSVPFVPSAFAGVADTKPEHVLPPL